MAKSMLTLREKQFEGLRALRMFDDLCKEHGLRYSLDYGTIIGAVRHKGFIPWDDDVDVCMPRPDFEKMLSMSDTFKKEDTELQGYFGLPLEVSSHVRFVSLRAEINHTTMNLPGRNYIWVDIFPIDGNPDDLQDGLALCQEAWFPKQMLTAGLWRWKAIPNRAVATACLVTRPILRSYPFRMYWTKRLKSVQLSVPYGSTGTVGSLASLSHGEDRMPIEQFEKTVMMEFEGYEFPVMSCWEQRLHNWYGDYMQLPPEDQRINHQLDAWWTNGFGPEQ
jgi:lipopolysaccharide cholinephosphotransferase